MSAVKRNQNRAIDELDLFEVGQVFLSDAPAGQRVYATAIRAGTKARSWRRAAAPVDVFDAKADLAALLDLLGYDIDNLQLVAEPAAWSHPGRGGRLQLGPKNIFAWFGELHPALVAELDLDGPVVGFELDLGALPEPKKKPTRTKPQLALSDLMPLSRDFAFVVNADVSAQAILKAAQGADKKLITGASVFDVYEGEHVGKGKKSVAIAVNIQPRDKTLTDEDIEADLERHRHRRLQGDRRDAQGVTPLPRIVSFWHGPLSWLERISIASFVRQGHEVRVYAYEPQGDLPSGAEWQDAEAVLPREKLFFYKNEGTPGVFFGPVPPRTDAARSRPLGRLRRLLRQAV